MEKKYGDTAIKIFIGFLFVMFIFSFIPVLSGETLYGMPIGDSERLTRFLNSLPFGVTSIFGVVILSKRKKYNNSVIGKNIMFMEKDVAEAFSKHSEDFGEYVGEGRTALVQFKEDIIAFIDNPESMQKKGSWKGQGGVHIFNPNTDQWVFINKNGTFNTAAKLPSDKISTLIGTSEQNI